MWRGSIRACTSLTRSSATEFDLPYLQNATKRLMILWWGVTVVIAGALVQQTVSLLDLTSRKQFPVANRESLLQVPTELATILSDQTNQHILHLFGHAVGIGVNENVKIELSPELVVDGTVTSINGLHNENFVASGALFEGKGL